MFNLFSNLTNIVSTGTVSSFLSASFIFKFIGTFITNIFNIVLDFLMRVIWYIISFIFGIMEAFEYIINSFLGIGTTLNDAYTFINQNNSKWVNSLIDVFKAIVAVAIVLLIIFTIYAIIKQEMDNAFKEGQSNGVGNSKKNILLKAFRNIMSIILLPVTMVFIISGVNSILTAFSNALKGGSNVTVAGQVLISSTYDANRYRSYANTNKRIPIVISAYDVNDYGSDQNDLLKLDIQSIEVQNKLINTATMMSKGSYLTFNQSLLYKNNKLINNVNFGDYYENFVCTAEQYQVMADFIDYAQKNNINFYIKALDEVDIEWKYVDSTVFEPSSNSLTISYRDASDLDNDGNTNDNYSITYSMSYNVTSPISDSLKSILALLGVGEYSDNLYKVMERDENFTNVVQWANEKVWLQLSEKFNYNDLSSWTDTDQIIMFEYYRPNSDLSKYTVDNLKEGIELDAYQIVYQKFSNGLYVGEETINSVLLNGNYYRVEKSKTLSDAYGNLYYLLSSIDGGNFLENAYTTITKTANSTELKTSKDFDINDVSTWTYSDQVLIYEYFKNTSYENSLRKYDFFYYTQDNISNIKPSFKIYKIENYTRNKIGEDFVCSSGDDCYYVLLNGTYYQVTGSDSNATLFNSNTDTNFMNVDSGYIGQRYLYTLSGNQAFTDKVGINLSGTNTLESNFVIENLVESYFNLDIDTYIRENFGDDVDIQEFDKYFNFEYKFSKNFKFNDVKTWTYRDYFIFYLVVKYRNLAGSASIESIKEMSLSGNVGVITTGEHKGEFVYRVSYTDVSNNTKFIYLKIDDLRLISEELMTISVDFEKTFSKNNFTSNNGDLLISNNGNTYDTLYNNEVNARQFIFSEEFDEYRTQTWTVTDFLLYYFSKINRINSLSDIKSNGYNALVSVVTDTTYGTREVFRFGKNDTAFYVDSAKVLNITDVNGNSLTFKNIDEWLNMKLIDFICRKLNLTEKQLIADETGVIGNIFDDYSQNVLSSAEIISEILKQSGFHLTSANKFDISKNPEIYNYVNENFKEAELDTWNYMDFLLYKIFSENNKTYRGSANGNVIIHDNKKYFIVDNLGIDITDCTLKSDYRITSEKLDNFDIQSIIFTEQNLLSKNLVLYIDQTFSYTYFSSNNTVFDRILKKYFSNMSNNATIKFNVYTDGNDNYIRVVLKDGTSIFVKTDDGNAVLLNTNLSKLELKGLLSTGAFVSNGEYKSFQENKYTKVDAMIYKLLGKSNENKFPESQNYKIYVASGKKYILVGEEYIECVDNLTIYNKEQFAAMIGASFDGSLNEVLVEYLYKNIYSKYVYKNIELTRTNYDFLNVKLTEFEIDDINTWSPLNIILYYLGFTDSYFSNSDLYYRDDNYNIYQSVRIYELDSDGNKIDDNYTEYYIRLDEILVVDQEESDYWSGPDSPDPENGYTCLMDDPSSLANAELLYNLSLITKLSGKIGSEEEFYANIDTYREKYLTFHKYIDSLKADSTTLLFESRVKNVSDLYSRYEINNNMSLSDPSTWNFFTMLYYYYMKTPLLTDNKFLVYTNSQNARYYAFSTDLGTYYIKNIENDVFSQGIDEVVEYSGSILNLTTLGIVVNNLTQLKQATIKKFTIAGFTFYYLKDNLNNDKIIYGLPDRSLDYAESNNELSYRTENSGTLEDWSIFDYILYYVNGNAGLNNYSTKIYLINNDYYFKLNSQDIYLNITKLIDTNKISRNDKVLTINNISGNNFKNLLGRNNVKLIKNIDDLSYNDADKILEWSKVFKEVDELSKYYLSDNFNVNDFSTWTYSDFIIYYYFHQEGYFDGIINFQEIINQGYVEVSIGYIITEDEMGVMRCTKVISFAGNIENQTNVPFYIRYDVLNDLSNRKLSINDIHRIDSGIVNISIKESHIDSSTLNGSSNSGQYNKVTDNFNFEYVTITNSSVIDFKYYNNYYFKIYTELVDGNVIAPEYDKLFPSLSGSNLNVVSEAFKAEILSGKAKQYEEFPEINMKLSEGYKIDDPSTWTILDLILMYEYQRNLTTPNYFAGKLFSELTSDDNLPVFANEDKSEIAFTVNGSVYKLNYKFEDESVAEGDENRFKIIDVNTKLKDIDKKYLDYEKIFVKSNSSDSNLKILHSTTDFVLISNDNSFVEPNGQMSISITDNDRNILIKVDNNIYTNYRVMFYALDNYTISPLVREVNWPQKLMNDMQVIYPDLNWNTLIATDGWLDTLGDFSSAYASGEFESEGNSSNITAAGLVLSEFFLTIASESNSDYAKYNYNPIFDQETIKALILAIMGEDEYENLVLQSKIFIDMFNSMFSTVLDDIARENGYQIVDGKVDNFTMCVYKSYLATVLLSSDMGEYFYKIATRVYAQYTIYESLAAASGDYAMYYAYINGLTDEFGNVVDTFTYSTFKDLVIYENKKAGKIVPTFTFNYNNVYQYFKSNGTLQRETGITVLPNEDTNYEYYNSVLKLLDKEYNRIYLEGNRSSVSDNSSIYCYLLDAYYSMVQSAGRPTTYMSIYHDYIMGKIARWSIVDGVSVTNGSSLIKNYNKFLTQRTIIKFLIIPAYLRLFVPDDIDVEYNGDSDQYEKDMNAAIGDLQIGIGTNYALMEQVFGSSLYRDTFNNAFGNGGFSAIKDIFELILGTINKSENGDAVAWEKLNKLVKDISTLQNEFSNVMKLSTGAITENGSIKVNAEDEYYKNVYSNLESLSNFINTYVGLQNKLDIITKTSITYSLAQFSHNYIPDGYVFHMENRTYTLSSYLSTTRIAEYVYGGSFLESFGVGAEFTSPDFDGFIQRTKTYDSKDNMVKSKLYIWEGMRTFASKLANYTARMYYLTNFNDLSGNVSDSVYLSDVIGVVGSTNLTTIEYQILKYLMNAEDIAFSTDTLIALLYKDTVNSLSNLFSIAGDNLSKDNRDLMMKLARYLEGKDSITEEEKRQALETYINFVVSDLYNSSGKYISNSWSGRIHEMFKNMISYLLINEETDESKPAQTVDLDNITMKEFKLLLMDRIVDYEQNPSETSKENTSRYIAMFNLISGHVNYTYKESSTKFNDIGRTVGSAYLRRIISEGVATAKYRYKNSDYDLFGEFVIDKATRNLVIELAGISNRPLEELVGLEYGSIYDTNGNYDEALGDTFVLCSFDEITGKYVPFMAASSSASFAEGSGYNQYVRQYGSTLHVKDLHTEYYANERGEAVAYPIVAKGLISATGLPTAIRIVDYNVQFYRTNITATTSLDEGAMKTARLTSESKTIGYTKFVETTSKSDITDRKKARFIGSSDISFFLNSGASVYYMQYGTSYNITGEDSSISVLDGIENFYKIGMMEYFMIALGIAVTMPILFKVTALVMRRILDLIFLTLAGPLMISMNTLNYEGQTSASNKAFEQWKTYLTQTLLFVFGYIMGINIYYILISTITNMTFVSASTVSKISAIGGLSFVNASSLNMIVKFIFIAVAAGTIKVSADMLASIITTGKVSKAFESPMGGDVMGGVKGVIDSVKDTGKKARDAISGKTLLEAKDAAVAGAKNMIPGSAIIQKGVDIKNKVQTAAKAKALEKGLEAYGVPPEVAKKAAQMYKKNENDQREAKKRRQRENVKNFAEKHNLKELVSDDSKSKKSKKEKKNKKPKKKKQKKDKKK